MELFPVTDDRKKWIDKIWEQFKIYDIKLTPEEIDTLELCRNSSVYSIEEQKVLNKLAKKISKTL